MLEDRVRWWEWTIKKKLLCVCVCVNGDLSWVCSSKAAAVHHLTASAIQIPPKPTHWTHPGQLQLQLQPRPGLWISRDVFRRSNFSSFADLQAISCASSLSSEGTSISSLRAQTQETAWVRARASPSVSALINLNHSGRTTDSKCFRALLFI